MLYQLPLQLLVAATSVLAAPLDLVSRANVIAYNKIAVSDEGVPENVIGELYLKFKPLLSVENGCMPYPAIDANGDISGGLAPIDGRSDKCQDSSRGQVYARSGIFNNKLGIMYSWYFPGDARTPQPGKPLLGVGHKHDWQNVVVWLSSVNRDATLDSVAYSGASGYEKSRGPPTEGGRPIVGYRLNLRAGARELASAGSKGSLQKLVAYERFTNVAKESLENADYGAAKVPFSEAHFNGNLQASFF